MLREIKAVKITNAIRNLFIEANQTLPNDIYDAVCSACNTERNALAISVLDSMIDNIAAARELQVPICQDTGMAVVFLKIGQDVHITDGDLNSAIEQGVRLAYMEGLLRKSVVVDPLRRSNTNDNTPPIIHTEIVSGDKVEIIAAPKGFGSENMSGVRMLVPAAGRQGVIDAVLDIVQKAGSNPCPPMVIGVGIGGDFESCALLSKKALCRPINSPNPDPFYAELEKEILQRVNELDIGPQGFGGDTTAFGLNIEVAPTHIAGLPVAVNIGCHVTRHASVVL